MAKDMRLVNIYIKIHNKKTLTIDDLAYLAEYNPECFQKTCDNLTYNMPESKPLMPPKTPAPPQDTFQPPALPAPSIFEPSAEEKFRSEQLIQGFLENMRTMETGEIAQVQHVDLNQVKDLMGNLYMEMMFPHSGVPGYFHMYDEQPQSTFNIKA